MPSDPSLACEIELWAAGAQRVAGVDECGRGPGAGPVVSCALVFAPGVTPLPGVRDSKQVSPKGRAHLAGLIRAQALALGLGAASVAEIDRLNIRNATALAMRRALARLLPLDHILLDGPLLPGLEQLAPVSPLIGGDARCYTIAAASIVAKEMRDRLMRCLGERHPAYGWQRNAGYLTAEHLAALAGSGVSAHHRRTFAPVRRVLQAVAVAPAAGDDAATS